MEKKHSNPYLEHIGSQQKLFEPMIPTRPIRDVNNHSKVIYIDETRERIPDPPNPRNLLIPMDFHEPDAIDMSNKEILKMKGLVSEPVSYTHLHEARTKAKERKKHHRDRLNLSNDQIKYLDKVVIPEGCSYQVNDHTFSSIDKALAYCKRLSIERCKKIWGAGIPISITNPNAPKIFDLSLIHI